MNTIDELKDKLNKIKHRTECIKLTIVMYCLLKNIILKTET